MLGQRDQVVAVLLNPDEIKGIIEGEPIRFALEDGKAAMVACSSTEMRRGIAMGRMPSGPDFVCILPIKSLRAMRTRPVGYRLRFFDKKVTFMFGGVETSIRTLLKKGSER